MSSFLMMIIILIVITIIFLIIVIAMMMMMMIYLSLSHGYGGDMAPGASSSTAKASPLDPLRPQDSVECHI